MSVRILVTGANGFVGSHVLEALTRQDEVTPVAACRDAHKLPSWYRGEVREGDLRDDAYVNRAVQGIDVLCHAAAWTSLWGHAEASRQLFLTPSLRLLDAAIAHGVKRVINNSTTSAAAPAASSDPMSLGVARSFWPHLCSVVAIEDHLRHNSGRGTVMVNLRLGIFAGERYNLGLLPILLPRLKTHLVPWVAGGKTGLPLIDGRDIAQAFVRAALTPGLEGYDAFNIVGPCIPTVREVVGYLHSEYGYPEPHFSVPFSAAYGFAWLMEKLDPWVPWDPLVTRSIVHLLEETAVDNEKAERVLGYTPHHHWKEAVDRQMAEMAVRQTSPMKMYRPVR